MGSAVNTSTPAPAMVPAASASASAFSSTMPPRATFSTRAVFFIIPSSRAPIMLLVSAPPGTWRVRKSTFGSSSSTLAAASYPSSATFAAVTNGSSAMTPMSRPLARRATSRPMRPRPTTPSVLPATSVPTNLLRSHPPAFMVASATGMRRASASRSAIVCSAAETVFPPGVFITTTPLRVAAATSMVSTPTPARATARSLPTSSKYSAVSLGCERQMTASALRIAALSSSPLRPGRLSTSIPAAVSSSIPATSNLSAISTRGISVPSSKFQVPSSLD